VRHLLCCIRDRQVNRREVHAEHHGVRPLQGQSFPHRGPRNRGLRAFRPYHARIAPGAKGTCPVATHVSIRKRANPITRSGRQAMHIGRRMRKKKSVPVQGSYIGAFSFLLATFYISANWIDISILRLTLHKLFQRKFHTS